MAKLSKPSRDSCKWKLMIKKETAVCTHFRHFYHNFNLHHFNQPGNWSMTPNIIRVFSFFSSSFSKSILSVKRQVNEVSKGFGQDFTKTWCTHSNQEKRAERGFAPSRSFACYLLNPFFFSKWWPNLQLHSSEAGYPLLWHHSLDRLIRSDFSLHCLCHKINELFTNPGKKKIQHILLVCGVYLISWKWNIS